MKLKIEYIENVRKSLIEYLDEVSSCDYLVKIEDNVYSDIRVDCEYMYKADAMYKSILDDVSTFNSFQKVYSLISGSTVRPKYGFYLGVPYYTVEIPQIAKQITKLRESAKKNIDCCNDLKNRSTNRVLANIDNLKAKINQYKKIKIRLVDWSKCDSKNLGGGWWLKEHLDGVIPTTTMLHIHETWQFESEIQSYTKLIEDAQSSSSSKYIESKIEQIELDTDLKIAKINDDLKSAITSIEKRDGDYQNLNNEFANAINNKVEIATKLHNEYIKCSRSGVENYLSFILRDSFYWFEFDSKPSVQYNTEDKTLIVEYCLPNIDEIPNIKEKKVYKTSKPDELKFLSERELNKIYDDFIYAITLRSIAEIFHFDECNKVDTVMFNGMVEDRSKITGKLETTCILSIMVKKSQFEDVDFGYVDAKALFKHLKGVSATKLHTLTAIAPIMEINRSDKRFVESHSVGVDSSTNLAAMDWEEFEHLIRELFEKEFNVNGGEVKVTQSSRDGGVDAIAFDPDPIRGGKIVIQAKRYTNTVGVSAVRDLYGTVLNEGANKGILVTTSDYGSDSYDFAKGKPITLLNGGHILYLLEKHGQKARIDIEEARLTIKTPN